MYPSFKQSTLPPQYEQRLALLRQEQIKYQRALETAKRTAKNFNTDPSARHFAAELKTILDEIERIHSMAEASTERGRPDTAGTILEFADEELRHYRTELKKQLGLVQESMPKYQEYLTRVRAREDLERRIARMDRQIEQFALLANSHEKPVEVFEPALEPNSPARPRRALWIAFIASGGIGLGLGLVCLIESLDHSIRGPDQLAAGLVLPVFGVIPRIRRSAANTRGGHLWTAGDPGTLEADAFRNLRVGLLGHTDSVHRFTSILVTSAKAGEGKSTTALNLAAACARAGERTLLLDCDLRRSSLGDVFDIEPGEPGLVDVLRGDLPWTSAVARSDSLPNLFFLPIGDPTGIPIEVLGTVEQRRLIEAAVTQFDRVILDGPAVLGLADCRMLGRLVDSVLLVVRAGSADLRPARWAKHALDQSRVPVAGVVFNDLSEEVKLWSNGGYRAGELERHASWEDHRALTGPHSSSQSEPQPEPDGAGMVA
jgi:capsular exopolysaccharide synthesis family protein